MTPPCTLTKVSDHVYWFSPDSRTDRPSLAAVVGTHSTLLLDVGASPAHTRAMLDALHDVGVRAPRYAALTHAHWDHFFGASALDVPLFAHTLTAESIRTQAGYTWDNAALDARVAAGVEIEFCRDMMQAEMTEDERRALRLIVPDVVFNDALTVDLGGVTCRLEHVGGDHARDSSVMFVPEDRVLFLGDCLYPAIYAPERYYKVDVLLPLIEKIESCGAALYLKGHSDSVILPDELNGYIAEFRTMADLVGRHGADRDAVIAALPADRGESLLELVDAFVVGAAL